MGLLFVSVPVESIKESTCRSRCLGKTMRVAALISVCAHGERSELTMLSQEEQYGIMQHSIRLAGL